MYLQQWAIWERPYRQQ